MLALILTFQWSVYLTVTKADFAWVQFLFPDTAFCYAFTSHADESLYLYDEPELVHKWRKQYRAAALW